MLYLPTPDASNDLQHALTERQKKLHIQQRFSRSSDRENLKNPQFQSGADDHVSSNDFLVSREETTKLERNWFSPRYPMLATALILHSCAMVLRFVECVQPRRRSNLANMRHRHELSRWKQHVACKELLEHGLRTNNLWKCSGLSEV